MTLACQSNGTRTKSGKKNTSYQKPNQWKKSFMPQIPQENWLSKASTTKTCRHVVPRSHPSHHHHRHPWHKWRELRNLVWCSSFIFRGAKPLWSQKLARLCTESYKSWCLLHVFQQDARLNQVSAPYQWVHGKALKQTIGRLSLTAVHHLHTCQPTNATNHSGLIMFQPRNHRHKHCRQVLIQSALSFLHGRGNGNLPNSFRQCWPAMTSLLLHRERPATKESPQEKSPRSMTQRNRIGLTKGLW